MDSQYLVSEAATATKVSKNQVTLEQWTECDGKIKPYAEGCAQYEQTARYLKLRIKSTFKPLFKAVGFSNVQADGCGDAAQTAQLRSDYEATLGRLSLVEARIDKDFPTYRELISPKPLELVDAQKALAPGEGLLLLVAGGDAIYSFALTPGTVAWNRTDGNAKTILQQVQTLRCDVDLDTCSDEQKKAIDAVPATKAEQDGHQRFDLVTANALYKALIAPVDGILTASEASQLSILADWVILSACNTASTASGAGGSDSLSALARAFLYAGAHALLASHWQVSDAATAALTVETLTARRHNPKLTRAQALQQAMHSVRTGKRPDGSTVKGWNQQWLHPSAWAPFSHIANSDE